MKMESGNVNKVISILCTILLLVVVTGCGAKDESNNSDVYKPGKGTGVFKTENGDTITLYDNGNCSMSVKKYERDDRCFNSNCSGAGMGTIETTVTAKTCFYETKGDYILLTYDIDYNQTHRYTYSSDFRTLEGKGGPYIKVKDV